MTSFLRRLSPFLFPGVVALGCVGAQGADYYVSSSDGNDGNDGLSEATPWQSVSPLNETIFDDDTTIRFKRGEVFRGSVRLKRAPQGVSFGAYGDGERPVLAGSVAISGWQPTTHPSLPSVVYEADVSTLALTENGIEQLFADGELMTIARYPNVDSPRDRNWLRVGATAGDAGFTDPALATYGTPDDYWRGATLRIRNYSWTFMVTEITGSTAANGGITAERLSGQLPEWGYFIDGRLTELDHPGEWFYDAQGQRVYFYPPDGRDPNRMLIEGSTFDTGIQIAADQHRAKLEQLAFRHYTGEGVYIGGAEDVLLQDCRFEHNTTGISVRNSPNAVVRNNTLDHQLKVGVVLRASGGFDVGASVVEDNHIAYTGMYPGYGDRYDGIYQGLGMSVNGQGYTLRRNVIEYSSHAGMALKDGGHHLVENNVIRDSMLLLNDGGAIVIGSDANVIRGNFLLHSVGNVDESNGCGQAAAAGESCFHHPSYGMGIGANPVDAHDTVIEDNTVANNAHQGIRLNSFINTTVRGNLLYNNGSDQVVIEDKHGGRVSRDNRVEGNRFYMLSPTDQMAVKLTNETLHGSLEGNHYCNPYNEVVLERDSSVYSLADWKSHFADLDRSSSQCALRLERYQVSEAGASLIANGTFDASISGWRGIGEYDATRGGLDGGSLKASGAATGNVLSPNLEMVEGQLYRLRFSIAGSGYGTIRLRINNVAPDAPERLLWERQLAYDGSRKEYEWFFTSPVTTAKGKVLWATTRDDTAVYWLDNVAFEPVTGSVLDPTRSVGLMTNPTAEEKTLSLRGTGYSLDSSGNPVERITLAPFSSEVVLSATRAPATLLPSQSSYRDGESIRVTVPPLPEGQAQYIGLSVPGEGQPIYLLSERNRLTPFDGNSLARWLGGEVAIELQVTADLPRGRYPLYLLRVPEAVDPLADPQSWALGVSGIRID